MALYVIPVAPRVPLQEQETTLDGRPFRLRFSWIDRIQRWALDLYTGAGVPIVLCKGLVCGADILRQSRANPAAPQGVLAVVDTSGANTDPTLDTLGTRHRILYFSEG